MASLGARTRSLYRSFLREMPARRTSQSTYLRKMFDHRASHPKETLDSAEQHLIYLRSQRIYVSLLERYNPGLNGDMSEQERVRLSARRVGINLPVDDEGNLK